MGARGESLSHPRPTAPAHVPPVRVYTLDGFRLEIGHSSAAWARTNSRPLLLLKVLVALGIEDVALDLLCEHLWADADGDHAHDAFHTTLKRLRGLIGRDAVRLQAGRLTLRSEYCWVDAQALSKALADAAEGIRRADVSAVCRHMGLALDLYRRPFLDGEADPPPFVAARDHLSALLRRHVRDAGEFLTRAGQPEQAIALYRRGLEAEELAEDLHQQLLRLCLRLGRIAEGLEAFRRCRDALGRGLSVEPSHETLELHHQLQARASAELLQSVVGDVAGSHDVGTGDPQHVAGVRIAVLPFQASPKGGTGREFADGIFEDLMVDLAKMSLLTVLGHQVGVAYNAGPKGLTAVAQASDVPYILTGRVRQANGHIRVNVRLLETRSGHQLWGERFEGDARDVFQVQDDIVASIVEETEVRLLDGEQARTWHRATSNRDATMLFLKAWHSWRSGVDREGADAIFRLLHEAVALDPGFSCAHITLGRFHLHTAQFGWADRAAALEHGLAELQCALALRPTIGETHAGLSTYGLLTGAYDEALAEATRSVACAPASGDNVLNLAQCQLYAGLPEQAIRTAQRAFALVPRKRPWYRMTLGAAHLMAGHPADALPWLASAAANAPNAPHIGAWLAAAYAATGRREQARATGRELALHSPDFDADWWARRSLVFRRESDRRRLLDWLATADLRRGASLMATPR